MFAMPKKRPSKAKRIRKDFPITCRVDDVELAKIDADRWTITAQTGIAVSRGSYSKSALLQYARHRLVQRRLLDMAKNIIQVEPDSSVELEVKYFEMCAAIKELVS
jgi:hypothetical protein